VKTKTQDDVCGVCIYQILEDNLPAPEKHRGGASSSPRRAKEMVGCLLLLVMVFSVVYVSSCEGLDKARGSEAKKYIGQYRGQDPGNDPWGNGYRVNKYHDEGILKVVITSAGKDGKFGTPDDIRGGYYKSVQVEVIER
jgi:hypothetical protein